jgi:hypothetical protein
MSVPLQETEYYTVLSHPDNPASKYVKHQLMLKDMALYRFRGSDNWMAYKGV